MVEYNGVDPSSGDGDKSVENLSKIKKLSKSPKSLKGLKNLQKLLVWKNIYQTTDLLSVYRCKKLY